MDQQRGRSLSTGHQPSHISQNHSLSPQQFQDNVRSNLSLATDGTTSNEDTNQQYISSGYIANNGLPAYVDRNEGLSQQAHSFPHGGLDESAYLQVKQEDRSLAFNQPQQQQTSFTQDLLGVGLPNSFSGGDFSLFSSTQGQEDQFDPSFFMSDLPTEPGNHSINPAELNMASPTNRSTSPSILQVESRSPASTHQSPSFSQNQFQQTPSHSRNVSLTPESAAFPPGAHVEWSMMPPQFTTHRRTPSEYSDVSVSSAAHSGAHSPNLGQHDSFDTRDQNHSPMLSAQDASMYQEVLRIGSFSLSDPQVQVGSSPAHSPAISPRLDPQQVPNMITQNSFMLGLGNGFGQPQHMYGVQASYPQPQQNEGTLDMGQAQQMVPPEINVEFAPASRQNSFEPPKPSFDALTPPDRGTQLVDCFLVNMHPYIV